MKQEIGAVTGVIDNLRRLFQAINEYSKEAERSTGLTGPQLWALKILAGSAPLRVSSLARRMCLRPPTVVGILDRLEAKGLVRRSPSREDRRVVELELTEQGRALVAQAPEVAQDMLIKGLDELSDEQFICVEQGMGLMVALLGAEQLVPQPLHS
ncbi:MarR family winged helix-turn-helix transcriptional regulator [Geobacter sp. SVR]|uniref:MarR family winged helix-turn-helix transcriptional regulator n=1 Tax=Geobacter sp. SVR TaxID=2495594 RepID=UPI00143EFD91|nr:MarR family transcriptional regulator [Geobacter sp. SVR]BCS53190.1 MarR family transcriptional regulator [Geobacter sp. SVR]GCF84575.1 MarR family transcriptional regulator [Geobacter sp. SVR]